VWVLDGEVTECGRLAGRIWTARVGWLPVVVLIGVVAATQAVAATLLGSVSSAALSARVAVYLLLSAVSYGAILFACFRIAAPVARECGGMSKAFGWRRPTAEDLGIGVAWAAGSFVVRLIVMVIVVLAIPALRGANSSNVSVAHHASVAAIIALGLAAVVIAPPVEELVFRGLVLRTAMRWLTFWPAALLSSVLFGTLHTYEVNTLAGATVLGLAITVFGLTQCLLVRWKGRLGPAIVSHAASNAFVLFLAVVASR
jgi:membrane protease YdiL (CAAX protease family)